MISQSVILPCTEQSDRDLNTYISHSFEMHVLFNHLFKVLLNRLSNINSMGYIGNLHIPTRYTQMTSYTFLKYV